MAKVFPQSQRPVLDPYVSTGKETFTIWMKSLVCQTNGCTVFDSNGDIVYRIDNYDKKCSNKVYLMDLRGRVLVTIRRKVLVWLQIGFWCQRGEAMVSSEEYGRLFCMGSFACQVTVGLDKYWVVKLGSKQAFRIVNIHREVIAEVKQKQSSSGISMGEDVLALAVEPHVDHSLIMAIVTVYGNLRDYSICWLVECFIFSLESRLRISL
ncbi:protein LURP-one-related [Salix suchowensis]|nr:protein LURP-one-related [Salix suchowensis]